MITVANHLKVERTVYRPINLHIVKHIDLTDLTDLTNLETSDHCCAGWETLV